MQALPLTLLDDTQTEPWVAQAPTRSFELALELLRLVAATVTLTDPVVGAFVAVTLLSPSDTPA